MWSVQSLLVPVDFSNYSEHTLQFADKIAQKYGSVLDVLHVTDIEKQAKEYDGYKGTPESLQKVIENEAEHKVNKLVKERDWKGLKVFGINITGAPVEKIIQVAKNRKSGIVVMATRGRDNITDFVIGSTTYKLIRTAPCPVLSIPTPKKEYGMGKIMFTTDFSTNSFIAYEQAVSLAKQFSSQLHIFYNMSSQAEDTPDLERKFFNLKDAAYQEGVATTIHAKGLAKSASDGILKYAEDENIDLVVIATHGTSGTRQFFLGSTTVDVISRAKTPVLLIRQMEY